MMGEKVNRVRSIGGGAGETPGAGGSERLDEDQVTGWGDVARQVGGVLLGPYMGPQCIKGLFGGQVQYGGVTGRGE